VTSNEPGESGDPPAPLRSPRADQATWNVPILAPPPDESYDPTLPEPSADEWVPGEPAARPASAMLARTRRRGGPVREVVETLLLTLLVFLAVRGSFQNFRVHGHSMDPTLADGEYMLVNRLIYAEVNVERLSQLLPFIDPGKDPTRDVFHSPERGDIIVLKDPRNPSGDRLVKRVIGLPGERIEIAAGHVYINGRELHEPYLKAPWGGGTPPLRIPIGEYFVMGDNRSNSEDSRYFGLVDRELIVGKAAVIFWPKDRFGLAPNESPALDQKVTHE
jgi:signal peptidase I